MLKLIFSSFWIIFFFYWFSVHFGIFLAKRKGVKEFFKGPSSPRATCQFRHYMVDLPQNLNSAISKVGCNLLTLNLINQTSLSRIMSTSNHTGTQLIALSFRGFRISGREINTNYKIGGSN